jgi:hypothetical protein
MEIHESILKVVAVNVMDLEDSEVAALHMTAILGGSFEGKHGVEKIEPLFTEGAFTMTADVKTAFIAITGQRLQAMRK